MFSETNNCIDMGMTGSSVSRTGRYSWLAADLGDRGVSLQVRGGTSGTIRLLDNHRRGLR